MSEKKSEEQGGEHSEGRQRETEHEDARHAERQADTNCPEKKGSASHTGKRPRSPLPSTKKQERVLRFTMLAAALVLLAVAGFLLWHKHESVSQLAAEEQSARRQGPLVETATVEETPAGTPVILEGEARPFLSATIFAKVSGYLAEIRVDTGAKVKTGDLLARISSPETDQAVAAAQASYANKARIARRYRALLRQKLVSAQEAEQYFTAAETAQAELKSRQQQKDYELVRAPFDGTVTSRLVDPGDLIPDASNGKSAPLALLTVATTDRLRVDAYLDQKYAPYVQAGIPVELFVPERADARYPSVIARVAGTLDRRTRMLPIEVDYDNREGRIVPGSFVELALKVPSPPYRSLPAEAVLSEKGQVAVAVVGEDRRVHFEPLRVAENDGSRVSFTDGPPKGSLVALNLGEEIHEGEKVRLVGAGAGSGMGSGGGASAASEAGQGSTAGKKADKKADKVTDEKTDEKADVKADERGAQSAEKKDGGTEQSSEKQEKQQKELEKKSKQPERGAETPDARAAPSSSSSAFLPALFRDGRRAAGRAP